MQVLEEKSEEIEKQLQTIPRKPGVYLIYDEKDEVIYVGKAKNLANRLRSHFAPSTDFSKSRVIREKGVRIEVNQVDSENEALLLEYNMIQEYQPWLNEKWKDGKTYPYLEVTSGETYPRIFVTRERSNPDSVYLGPFSDTSSLRNSLKYILQLFPIANCGKEIHLGDAETWAKTCMRRRTNQCMKPCEVEVAPEEYMEQVNNVISFLDGKVPQVAKEISDKMKKASEDQDYEQAAKYRDLLRAINRTLTKQNVMIDGVADTFVLTNFSNSFETAICLLKISDSRISRQEAMSIENVELDSNEKNHWVDFVMNFLITILRLHDKGSVDKLEPKEILVDTKMQKTIMKALDEFGLSTREATTQVDSQLVRMAQQHTRQYLQRSLLLKKDKMQYNSRVVDLQKILGMDNPPVIIDTFDVSTLLGKNNVASCVRFVNGKPEKKAYRRFKIKTVYYQDDFASMEEAVYRRYKGVQGNRDDKGLPVPDLVVIDGGAEQLKRAKDSLKRLSLSFAVIGLAKKEEEIYTVGRKTPIQENKNRPGLLLLRAGRDEAHRFAVKYQRTLRRKEGIESVLDTIKGIGPKRRDMLIKEYRTVETIAKESSETLSEKIGIKRELASEVIEACRKFMAGTR